MSAAAILAQRKRVLAVMVGLTTVIGLTSVISTAANAAPDDERRVSKAELVAGQIQDLVSAGNGEGFGYLRIDRNAETVELGWKGTPPSAVTNLAATLATTAKIELRQSRFTAKELDSEIHRLFAMTTDSLGGKPVIAAPLPDASGLELTFSSEPEMARAAKALSANRIPVQLTVGGVDPAYWRWDDVAPYYAGAVMERDGGTARCSTGFAALDSSNNSHMVTAEHCGTNKDWRTPIGHAAIGRSHAGVGHMDIMLVSGTAYSGVTYTGTYNNNIADPVVGTSEAVIGQQACPSGGYSGRDCRTTIGAVGVYIVLNGRTVGPAYRTDHNEGVASVGEGDSGGPVFSWATGSSVYAQGIISAISLNHLGACQGFAPAGRRCATRAYHMNLRRALYEVNLNIRLG